MGRTDISPNTGLLYLHYSEHFSTNRDKQRQTSKDSKKILSTLRRNSKSRYFNSNLRRNDDNRRKGHCSQGKPFSSTPLPHLLCQPTQIRQLYRYRSLPLLHNQPYSILRVTDVPQPIKKPTRASTYSPHPCKSHTHLYHPHLLRPNPIP